MLNEIKEAMQNAEITLGFEIPSATADYILGYTVRKFLGIISREEKPDGYFAVLLQNEIEDYFSRKMISSTQRTR